MRNGSSRRTEDCSANEKRSGSSHWTEQYGHHSRPCRGLLPLLQWQLAEEQSDSRRCFLLWCVFRGWQPYEVAAQRDYWRGDSWQNRRARKRGTEDSRFLQLGHGLRGHQRARIQRVDSLLRHDWPDERQVATCQAYRTTPQCRFQALLRFRQLYRF